MGPALGLLRKAQSLEEKSAAVYRAAAERFAAEPRWSRLFARLAEEETQHALRVQMLSSRLNQDRAALRDARLQDKEIDELLAAGDTLLRKISSPNDLSLPEVLSMLRAMEERFDAVHAHMILTSGDPGLIKFFTQLAAQDRAHAELLAGEPVKTPT